ncbi:MAG: signal peptidase I [Aureliella sp.]
MTSTAVPTSRNKAKNASSQAENPSSTRETVESVLVAFLLAFLFRAFVAEAFVIPTGSMAPTLMGAHKDLFCDYCGKQFQTSASQEFDQERGGLTGKTFIAACCSNCRGLNKFDFAGNPNHDTFSGDRILVSKFDYVLSSPKRWDVFVFKYPQDARMNYIKRLVGLPGESLLIREGDVYVRKSEAEDWQIARKPAHKIRPMRRVVSDTGHPVPMLVKAGWPGLWQPWSATGNSDSWTVNHTESDWSASLASSGTEQLLRYYHKVASVNQWENLLAGKSIQAPDPRASELVTDFLAYNATLEVNNRDLIYDKSGSVRSSIDTENRAYDVIQNQLGRSLAGGLQNRSFQWVGDLVAEFDLDVQSPSGTLLVDLYEFGVRYRCEIDVSTGQVTLSAAGENVDGIFDGQSSITGKSKLSGEGSYRVEMSNVDDQIFLWVNGSLVDFGGKSQFDSQQFRSGAARRPYWSESDPQDAAPIGIGGKDIAINVTRAQVFRDIYYIAARGGNFTDFDLTNALVSTVPDPAVRGIVNPRGAIQATYSNPQWWSESSLFSLRRSREYKLEEGQYFPMGDNSAASSDARVWSRGEHYVEQKYLLGKALLVFWPHTWNTPVPFTPNISRMNLIK